MPYKIALGILMAILICATFAVANTTDYRCYRIGFHIDSNISGGHYPPQKLMQMAQENGLDAVVFCDHDRFEVEYGFPPLRNLVKKKSSAPSISTYGFSPYFNLLDSLDLIYPDLTVIKGAEVNPDYYWSGNPVRKNLTLNNWHQHLMVMGLPSPSDYEKLPSTASHLHPAFSKFIQNVLSDSLNHGGLTILLRQRVLLDLVVIIGLGFCLFIFSLKLKKKIIFGGKIYIQKRLFHKVIAIIAGIFFLTILINDFPFTPHLYDPYSGDNRLKATQDLIDYVNSQKGLIFFSHPEVKSESEEMGVRIITQPYTDLLLTTQNYTGFAVFGEGWKMAGAPGQIWDQVLMNYCQGSRERPVWIVGELDFEGDLPGEFLNEVRTCVWAPDSSETSILNALKEGRCWASQIFGSRYIYLREWNIADSTGSKSISGQELNPSGPISINIDIDMTENQDPHTLYLIRNSEIIETHLFTQTLEITFEDAPPLPKNYYRLWILNGNIPVIASNPIFVSEKSL